MDRKGNEARLIAAAADGQSHSDIGRAAGISVATVKRRLADPEIARSIRDVRLQQRRQHTAQLGALTSAVIRRLFSLVEDDDPHVALRAMTLALQANVRLTALTEFDERLTQLERSVDPEGEEEGSDA